MSLSSIPLFPPQACEFPAQPGDHVFPHVLTYPVPNCNSAEETESSCSIEISPKFESMAWSPVGITSNGGCCLAVAIRANNSFHVKVLEARTQNVQTHLAQTHSILEYLRAQWLLIPVFSPAGDRTLISQTFPSFSALLQTGVSRCTVSWSRSDRADKTGILFVSLNELIFILSVSASGVTVNGCLQSPSVVTAIEELKSSLDAVTLSVLHVDSSLQGVWEVVLGAKLIKSASADISHRKCSTTLSRQISNSCYTSDCVSGGVALSMCYSRNGAIEYFLKRTSRCAQIVRRISPTVTDIATAIHLLLRRAIDSPNRPLFDIAFAIGTMYQPKTSTSYSTKNADSLETIVSQLCGTFPVDSISSLLPDERTRNQLAFGLHTLHSRVDRISGSGASRIRANERAGLLRSLGVPLDQPITCLTCQALAKVDADITKAVCRSNPDHVFFICHESMEPIASDARISRCNFCNSVRKCEGGMEEISVCSICRIGVFKSVG